MAHTLINSEKLRGLIGQRAHYRGIDCAIIEVLEEDSAVVLQCVDESHTVQQDQFGDPIRRVPVTHTVPVLSPDGNTLHPEFKELGVTDPRGSAP